MILTRVRLPTFGSPQTSREWDYTGSCCCCNSRRSLFARLIVCTRANPEFIYRFYEFEYLDIVYPNKNLTELSYFPPEMKSALKTFHQKPMFVKFHTISPEKDKSSGIQYPAISLIQVGYTTKNFKLNIEARRKIEPFLFNESWINYRRTSGAFAVKCQGDCLYASRLQSLYSKPNFIILTKENIREGVYDDDFLKFLFQLDPSNFERTPSVVKKFTELIQRKEDRQAQLQTARILPP